MTSFTQYKDLVTILISVLTFFFIGLLVYWRENKKSFQEKIFEYKYAAYREILEQIGIFYQDSFTLLDEFQNFEGSEEEWRTFMLNECYTHYEKAKLLEKLYFKHLIILPENQLNKLRELTDLATGHITNHFHYKTNAPHESYDRLWSGIINFALESRKDISTDILNSSLGKRLSLQFYPISLPKKK
jgi:hypothetical protein